MPFDVTGGASEERKEGNLVGERGERRYDSRTRSKRERVQVRYERGMSFSTNSRGPSRSSG